MTKILKHFPLLVTGLWCLGTVTETAAQIVVTPSTGCAPLSVQFSGPAGATNVFWNLGAGTSNVTSPSNLYSNPGTYNITYTALVQGVPVTHTASLVVSAPPTASFSYTVPSTHCKPLVVPFKGTGGSPGSTYQWAFGDLTPLGTGSAVTHTYSSAGTFTPIMIVTDAVSGCTAVAQTKALVNISDPANIIITGIPSLNSCTGSLVTNVTASLSTSGSPLTSSFSAVSWTFSQGTPASGNGLSPGNVSFLQGNHTILVTVTDDNNCTTKSSVPVIVNQPSLSVTSASVQCLGEKLDKWMAYSTESVIWMTIPGGLTFSLNANLPPPDTLYYLNTPGPNVYTITAYPPFPCPAMTTTFSVFAETLTVTYVADTSLSCSGALPVTYTAIGASNYSASVLSYQWLSPSYGYNISTPTVATGAVVTFTFKSGPSQNPYTIYREWRPQPVVAVTSQHGCPTTYANDAFAMLHRPTAWFYNDKMEGCAPFATTFQDSSSSSYKFPLASFTLYTGNGTHSITSTSFSVFPYTYTYTSPGTYSAYMIVKTTSGCIDSSFTQVIRSSAKPSVSMVASSDSVCAGKPVQIHLSVTPSSLSIQHWHVASQHGIFHGCIDDSVQTSHFNHPGPQTLTLHAVHNGCEDTTTVANAIMVRGPLGTMRMKNNCIPGQQRTIEFAVRLLDADNATLNFGDGSSVSLTGTLNGAVNYIFTHTYSASADYVATLTSHNSASGCAAHIYTVLATPRQLVARISVNSKFLAGTDTFALGCEMQKLVIQADSSEDEKPGCGRGYVWLMSTPGYTFPMRDNFLPAYRNDTLVAGTIYRMVLRIKDVNECIAWDTIHFRMSKATPNFSPSANPICLSSGTVQMVNLSQLLQHKYDTIVNSLWEFGNGSPPYSPTLALEDPVVIFNSAAPPLQIFTIALTVTNNVGCSATFTLPLQVNNPFPGLQASTPVACVPKNASYPVILSANAGYSTYVFNAGLPGIGPVTTKQNSLSVPFYTPGVFVSTVQVTDLAGCSASDAVTVTAIGQATPHILLGDSNNKFCLPAVPVITSSINLYETVFTNTLWTVGKHSTAPPGTPVFNNQIFASTGVHTVVLRVNHNGYCEKSDTAIIIVADPYASLRVSKTRLCFGDTISLRVVDSAKVGGWQWFFGDFLPQKIIDADDNFNKIFPVLVYQYTLSPSDTAGRMLLALRYHGSGGACPRTATVNMQVVDIKTSFAERDDVYRHCLRRTDVFESYTKNNWALTFLHDWQFGDNTTGSGNNVSHTYSVPGTYDVRLVTRDAALGCRDTAVRTMTVLPLPEATLNVSRPLICPDDTITLIGTGKPGQGTGLTGTLTPAKNFTFTSINDFTLQTTAAATTTFGLRVTDENDCVSDPATAVVNVMLKPFPTIWDTTVIIGQTVALNASQSGGSNFTYAWVPNVTDLSCDSCYNPVSTTTVGTNYTVLVTDTPLNCFTTGHIFRITVLPNTSLDVPSAFTPNGDGINDVIYPEGWGLKRLLYFRIYNRWGQLIYETSELEKGWNGVFNGEPQNMETYVYQVAAETLLDTVLTKSGSFKLLR